MKRLIWISLSLLVIIGGLAIGLKAIGTFGSTLSLPKKVDYNFHVRPILSDKCFACHGPDEDARKADLRLDIDVVWE